MVVEILRQGAGWNLGLIVETAIQNVFCVTDELLRAAGPGPQLFEGILAQVAAGT